MLKQLKSVRSLVMLVTAFFILFLLPSGFVRAASSSDAGLPRGWVASHPIVFRHLPSAGALSPNASLAAPYTPAEIKTAYGFGALTQTGAGQTIAIVDAYGSPTIKADVTTFDQKYGLPGATITTATPQGKPSTNGGWALETSLDVEWAHALAPAAKVLLVEAKSASIANLLAGIDYATAHGATVVSNSWGGAEFANESTDDSHFNQSGIVYVASAGDDGEASSWPAASPYVLSVGGTSLSLNSDGTYNSESAWSNSGGATSDYEAIPSYQSLWSAVVGGARGIPDVAFDADPNTGVPVYTSTPDEGESGWFEVGGTSFSAPAWAALVALADQARGSAFSSSQLLTALYQTAGTTGSSGYKDDFHDITSGSNGLSAQPGYDLVTGIGSPAANRLVAVLGSK
ncbi:MAG: S53 family peptidase [Sporolactobacillus sp.]